MFVSCILLAKDGSHFFVLAHTMISAHAADLFLSDLYSQPSITFFRADSVTRLLICCAGLIDGDTRVAAVASGTL